LVRKLLAGVCGSRALGSDELDGRTADGELGLRFDPSDPSLTARGNAGLRGFVDGGGGPEYVPWGDVERIDFSR